MTVKAVGKLYAVLAKFQFDTFFRFAFLVLLVVDHRSTDHRLAFSYDRPAFAALVVAAGHEHSTKASANEQLLEHLVLQAHCASSASISRQITLSREQRALASSG